MIKSDFLTLNPISCYLGPPLANIHLHGTKGVDGEPLVGVDGDTEEAGVGVDQLVLVPDHRVPEDASVTEESEVSHVLRVVKLQRRRLEFVWVLNHFSFEAQLPWGG